MIKIFEEKLYWKGKLLAFTWHFMEEFDKLKKPVEIVLEILEFGKHKLISKRQNKFNVFYPYQNNYLCLSYVEHENILLIHIKPRRRK